MGSSTTPMPDTLQRNRGVPAQAKSPLALRLTHDRESVQSDDGLGVAVLVPRRGVTGTACSL